jgi:hypothetical protein
MKLNVAVLAVLATTLAAAPVLALAADTGGSGTSAPKARHRHHSSHHSSHHGSHSGHKSGGGSTSGASGAK